MHFRLESKDDDMFVAKYSRDGALLWKVGAGNDGFEQLNDVVVDLRGNIYVTGMFLQSTDFDLERYGGELTAVGNHDGFIAKYGAPLKLSEKLSMPYCNGSNGSIAVVPMEGTPPFSYRWNTGETDSILDAVGIGTYEITVEDRDGLRSVKTIFLDDSCSTLRKGEISGMVFHDLDSNGVQDNNEQPLHGYTVVLSDGKKTVTNLKGEYTFRGLIADQTYMVSVQMQKKRMCSWRYVESSVPTIPSTGSRLKTLTFTAPIATELDFGVKEPVETCREISGVVFTDKNKNGRKDWDEEGVVRGAYLVVREKPSGKIVRCILSKADGSFKVFVPQGKEYTLTARPSAASNYYYCKDVEIAKQKISIPVDGKFDFMTNANTKGLLIGMHEDVNFNVNVVSIRANAGRYAGKSFRAFMDYKTFGQQKTTCSLTLKILQQAEYISASKQAASVANKEIKWQFEPSKAPRFDCMAMNFKLDDAVPVGTDLEWDASYSCAVPDLCPSDNQLKRTFRTVSANSRVVTTNGVSMEVYSESKDADAVLSEADTVLSYIINFQNVGEDTVYHIAIEDTISDHLDVESISSAFSNLPYTFAIIPPNRIYFEFDAIQLPSSKVNERESHGFVQFNIKAKPNRQIGDSILNRASVAFNYGGAQYTNRVNTRIGKVDVITAITDEGATEIKDISTQSNSITAYPNPTTGMLQLEGIDSGTYKVLNIQGVVLALGESETKNAMLDISSLPAGLYIVLVTNGEGSSKAVKILKY